MGRKPSVKEAIAKTIDPNVKLPGKKALDFLTQGPPSRQRIQQFGRLTPIGAGSPTFGPAPRPVGKNKKAGF